jgi:hypothetical protein
MEDLGCFPYCIRTHHRHLSELVLGLFVNDFLPHSKSNKSPARSVGTFRRVLMPLIYIDCVCVAIGC